MLKRDRLIWGIYKTGSWWRWVRLMVGYKAQGLALAILWPHVERLSHVDRWRYVAALHDGYGVYTLMVYRIGLIMRLNRVRCFPFDSFDLCNGVKGYK